MRTFTPLLLASMAALSPACTDAAPLPDRVHKAAQERVDVGEYPVLVIGYIDGGTSEIDAFGKLDDGQSPDANTAFEIGSITKTFTATLLADAVQSGQTALDEPVAKLLPGFAIPSRGGKQITLLDLATQHSGLPRLPANLQPAHASNPYADYTAAKLKEFLASYTLPRDPGEKYEYSNLGLGLLGYALAEHAQASYADLVADRVLRPLGMTMSGTTFTAAMRARLAPGHGDDGKAVENWDFDALAGCGAMRSTVGDMLRYLKANMDTAKTPLTQAMKLAQQPRRDLGTDSHIGLAWMTHGAKPADVIWHNGMTGGYASALAFTTDGKRGVVVLTNITHSVDDLAFAALLDDAPLRDPHRRITMTPAALDDYVGDYRLAEHFVLNVSRKDGQLHAQATGQGAFPIFPSARDEFFAQIAGIAISFKRDANGKVDSLVLHQNGDLPAPRVAAAPAAAVIDAATLHDYAGKYQLAPNAVFDITVKDGALQAQLTGQPSFPIYAKDKDHFYYTVVDAQLDFERDAAGKIVTLVLHQNGHDMRAGRIAN